MFNEGEIISKSLFAEATRQMQRIFSTQSLHDLQLENNTKNPEDKSLASIFYMFCKHFLKMYGLRIIFMTVNLLQKKNLLKNFSNNVYDAYINMANLKSSFFVAIIPAIYDLLHKIFKNYFNVKSKIFTLLAGFISAFIGICFEDKSELVKFIILSIFARLMHSLLCLYAVKNGKSPSNKFYAFIGFTIICTIFNFFIYYVPGFKPIYNLSNRYSLANSGEIKELIHYRKISNIFPEDKIVWSKI